MDKLPGKTEGNGMTHKGHHKTCPENAKLGEKKFTTKLAPRERFCGVRNFSMEHFTKFFLPQQQGNCDPVSDAESQKKPPAKKKPPPKATDKMQQID
eukprot:scaffold44774_cov252-Amphora_coffeaeformis.AAC.1